MEFAIRPAVAADHARLIEIAAEGDADCDSTYLAFVAASGRLLCATVAGDVVAFGGMVPVGDIAGDIAMVTDLFAAAGARSGGIGSRLLTELLEGHPRRMTFSSQHPAAQAAYRRAGMLPRGRMLYLSGTAVGGGPQVASGAWMHGRDQLIGYFAARGSLVTPSVIVQVDDNVVQVLRIDAEDAIGECHRLLRAFDAASDVTLYVPEAHPLTAWLVARDFVVTDHDVLFTTEGVDLPPTLAALHPGLA